MVYENKGFTDGSVGDDDDDMQFGKGVFIGDDGLPIHGNLIMKHFEDKFEADGVEN